jgi:hypothetical protein
MVRISASKGIEVSPGREPAVARLERRVLALERLIVAIEAELCDDAISDQHKLENIGERVASAMDGR